MEKLADISTFEGMVNNSGFDSVCNGWSYDLGTGMGYLGRGIRSAAQQFRQSAGGAMRRVGQAARAGMGAAYANYAQGGTATQQPQQQVPQTSNSPYPVRPQFNPAAQQQGNQKNIKAGGVEKTMYLCQTCAALLAQIHNMLQGTVSDSSGMLAGGAVNYRNDILDIAGRFSMLAPSVYRTLQRLYS